jgi:hypothetical protein
MGSSCLVTKNCIHNYHDLDDALSSVFLNWDTDMSVRLKGFFN